MVDTYTLDECKDDLDNLQHSIKYIFKAYQTKGYVEAESLSLIYLHWQAIKESYEANNLYLVNFPRMDSWAKVYRDLLEKYFEDITIKQTPKILLDTLTTFACQMIY